MTAVNIGMIGDKALQRKLNRMVDRAQKKIVRSALRKGAKRTHQRIIQNIQQQNLVDSGTMLAAFKKMKIRQQSKRPRTLIRVGPVWPERADLGIDAGDKYYYPTAVEYGHGNVKAKPFVRPAVNNHKDEERRAIGNDIRTGIMKEARK